MTDRDRDLVRKSAYDISRRLIAEERVPWTMIGTNDIIEQAMLSLILEVRKRCADDVIAWCGEKSVRMTSEQLVSLFCDGTFP